MNSRVIDVAYSAFVNKGAFALLLGSGISRNSGIPTGWEITLDLIKQIAALEQQSPIPTPEEWYKANYGKEPDYSDILERITNFPEERINLLKPYIEPTDDQREAALKVPTKAHRQIAELVRGGYIRVIVTTNFDRLLENALKQIGIEPTVISNPSHVENTVPLIHSPITIVKINGDYLDARFLNIKSELETYDVRLVELLRTVFENYGLITCGWSATWDIALINVLKSANKFRYSNYFGYYRTPDETMIELSTYRRGQLIQTGDADSFFTDLTESVEALKKNEQGHPLLPGIALARLKKYLAKEEYRIELHDLIHQAVEDCYAKVNTTDLSTTPTEALVEEKIDAYFNQSSLLCILVANGCYWAKEYHYNSFVQALRRLVTPDEQRNIRGFAWWAEIIYFPALLLRYCAGISCVATGNYPLLKQLSIMPVKTGYENKGLIQLTNIRTVINEDVLRLILGSRYYTPMSELLQKRLRSYFSELLPIESDYQSYFDQYEFIMSILQFSANKNNYAAVGRFGHSNRSIVRRTLDQVNLEGANHLLLKNGLFSTKEDLVITLEKFDEFISGRFFG